MSLPQEIHIGTSGWHYEHWRGPFYPVDLPLTASLKFYERHFTTVEVNSSFYHLPKQDTLNKWRDTTGSGFTFSVKASRYITHMKKLKDGKETFPPFLRVIDLLGDKLGPILFQLPPRWHCNASRLNEFLEALPGTLRYAFEFRDPTWFKQELTANFSYVRLHGPGAAYQGQYDTGVLAGWARLLRSWARRGIEIFCYFDNDQSGYAVKDALRLKTILGISA